MFNKIKKITSLLILLSFTFSISYADDQLDVKTYVNNMRNSTYSSWILWDIFTKVFDTEWQIKDIFLSFVNTLTDWYIPFWNAGQLFDSPIYSILGNVWIWTTTLTEKLTIIWGISISKSPDSWDDVWNRDFNDARYLWIFWQAANSNLLDSLDSTAFQKDIAAFSCAFWISTILDDGSIICTTDNWYDSTSDTIADDNIIQETEIEQNSIDDSEIEDNSISSGSLAPNSVWDSELIDNPTFNQITINNSPVAATDVATKEYVDGGIWLPAWAVMPFYLSTCPTWWSEANGTDHPLDLRGTFIRWMNWAANSRDVARTLWDYQADDLMSHLHSVNPPSTASTSDGAHTHNIWTWDLWTVSADGPSIMEHSNIIAERKTSRISSAGDHTHTINIPAFNSASTWWTETKPKNIALLYCVKD